MLEFVVPPYLVDMWKMAIRHRLVMQAWLSQQLLKSLAPLSMKMNQKIQLIIEVKGNYQEALD